MSLMLKLINLIFLTRDVKRTLCLTKARSIRQKVFCKKGIPKNFKKFTGKTPMLESLFSKVVGLRLATLLKMRLQHRCFLVNFVKF